jgi:hypothetical protein
MNNVSITDGHLCYTTIGKHAARIPLADIALIGEYTTQSGPFAEDYFVLIHDVQDRVWEIGADEGAFEALEILSSAWSIPIKPELIFSTDFRSRILFPTAMLGRPLFVRFPFETLCERIKNSLQYRQRLSPDALDAIEQANTAAGNMS